MSKHTENSPAERISEANRHVLCPNGGRRGRADDRLHDECGVFGVFGHPEAATLTYLGLYALQHRGQEGAGIVCARDGHLVGHRGIGLVADVFKAHRLAQLEGDLAIGHVRYSTFGTSILKNVQPLMVDYARGSMALGHNGNLVNAGQLRDELEEDGAIFQSTTDSEVIIQLIARSKQPRFADAVAEALGKVIGAYSLLATNGETIVAARDPRGFRPLWLGRLGDGFVFASESCALDIIDAAWDREIEPGEVVVASEKGIEVMTPFERQPRKLCAFEFIYMARPDSVIFGRSVDAVRKRLGANLAREAPVAADLVMPVPDSSNQAALGYSHESGIPFDMGFIRNHYVGRTFIEPDQKIRDFGVKIKLNPTRSAIEGKRIVLIDDSIVRGTTSRKIISTLRRCGATEVHFRVSSPPIVNSCHYGIDTPNRERLIASSKSVDEIRKFTGVDSLAYLSIDGLIDATGYSRDDFCLACFDNAYPTPVPDDFACRQNNRRHYDLSTDHLTYDGAPAPY
ncbi:MAG TPA: amidophosphoribosyltransferase [Candidatus Hydrogenedentes bacterium]|nr:amidophosphoribosyltransferase [Candidatus Hydrogenedentota bacterium]